ncbi:Asp23/Gls24 family envelope stress response protein [Synergistaceae bacterium OttesenSCG-928-D05]|nr:Asp23/Gls24 family envelope stress response protein [Synergistaceae bacterium OttesenSCG-928-D05]
MEEVHENITGATIDQTNLEGKIRISEDVIAQLATKALNSVEGVQPANPGLMANLRLGRKTTGGVRISISEGEAPEISVDAYITVKYGLRIPDVCWDVQEAIKDQIERFTGYAIKGVNIYVQGIGFAEKAPAGAETEESSYPTFGEEA